MIRETLILTDRDVKALIDMRQAIGVVEKAFASHGRSEVQMPPKLYIPIEKYDGDFRAMPAYIGQTDSCGVKWVNVHTGNRKLGMPAVMAVIILSDPSNGMPLAIIAGTYITNLRTGAAGAVAAKYLANSFSSSAGFVGCGSQALFQLMALLCIFKLKTVFAYDAEPDQLKRFVQRAKLLGVAVKISDDVPSCVAMKDIVVTTTPSRKPIIRADWISPGTHINAIGADAKGKSELDPAILTKSKVVVDDVAQAAHSGEINVPMADGLFKESDIYATLGQIVIGKRRGRTSKSEITVFDSTGLAIQDIAAATYIYRRAIASGGIRRKVSFL